MDMNKVRDTLHEVLERWGCTFEFDRGRCWITSPVDRMGFSFLFRGYEIYGLKIGEEEIPFGGSFSKKLCDKISEIAELGD